MTLKALEHYRRLHFIGIGGAGMSAIATVLARWGHEITGSDLGDNAVTRRLKSQGIVVHQGHRAEHVEGADLVITSTAIREDNPERQASEAAGKPIWRRARILAEIMRSRYSLAVGGTHGKTTTTAMMSQVLTAAEMDPTVLIGGDTQAYGGNAQAGEGDWVVAEADESDGSLLEMEPDRIILTNVEADHLDYYRDLDHVCETFKQFIGQLRPGGKIVACLDSPALASLLDLTAEASTLTYAIENQSADLIAKDIRPLVRGGAIRFTPVLHGKKLGSVHLKVPGDHNVSNALAVILMGLDLGVEFETISVALSRFGGVNRRYQTKGAVDGVKVIDDYAHHPTEIRATLDAARRYGSCAKDGRIIAVFQPHRYSRTKCLSREFGRSFGDADMLIVTDIYAAGEDPIDGVSAGAIVEEAKNAGHCDAHYVGPRAEVVDFLKPRLKRGDVVFTLGAGDVWEIGESLLEALGADARSGNDTRSEPIRVAS